MSFLQFINKFNEVSEFSIMDDLYGFDDYCELNNSEHQTNATFAHNSHVCLAHKETYTTSKLIHEITEVVSGPKPNTNLVQETQSTILSAGTSVPKVSEIPKTLVQVSEILEEETEIFEEETPKTLVQVSEIPKTLVQVSEILEKETETKNNNDCWNIIASCKLKEISGDWIILE